jgi:hypothetical protein
MKNKTQVRRNGGKKSPSSQVKTQDGEIQLVLFNGETGSLACIVLTGQEFETLRARAKKLKISLDEMLCEGVYQMLRAKKLHLPLGPALSAPSISEGGAS